MLSGRKAVDFVVSEGESYGVLPVPRRDIAADQAQFDRDVAAWSRLDSLRDSSSSSHNGAGSPASIRSLRQRSWMACAIGSTDPSHIGPTLPVVSKVHGRADHRWANAGLNHRCAVLIVALCGSCR
jgi:hypothetical protein